MKQRIVNQLVHTLSYGDAISSEVLAMHRLFNAWGLESRVYCLNIHPKLRGKSKSYIEICTFSAIPEISGELILHYSLGSPLNELYLQAKACKRAMIYHNLTPPHWFRGVNPRIRRDIEQGLEELPKLCEASDLLIADSSFNAGELAQLGFPAHVLPLPVDVARWSIKPNAGIKNLLSSDNALNVLHVGRLAPNKCIEDIIKTFYFLHHHVEKESRLWVIGIDTDTELYSFSLKRLVYELGLEDAVTFAGCRDDGELRAFYENATVYVCMSEHEGFCLPVVESMYFGLPVVAYAASALPETVGEGGVLLREKRHPEVAELLAVIAKDEALRTKLIEAGKRRAQALSLQVFEDNLRALLGSEIVSSQKGVTGGLSNDRRVVS